jgi:hypothetical protein
LSEKVVGKISVRIEVPAEEIAAFCRRNRIRRLAFSGSVLRDDFTVVCGILVNEVDFQVARRQRRSERDEVYKGLDLLVGPAVRRWGE